MNKEINQEIREHLKKQGFGRQEVSVRSTNEHSTTITMKKPFLDEWLIRRIGDSYKHVAVEAHTQEILAGGNHYITYDYSEEVEAFIDNYCKEEIVNKLPSKLVDNQLYEVQISNIGILLRVSQTQVSISTPYRTKQFMHRNSHSLKAIQSEISRVLYENVVQAKGLRQ